MEARLVGGVPVSRIGLGTMNFGSDWHGVGALGEAQAACLLDLAIERGVTLIDTADVYGRGAAESMLGRLLKKRRKKLVLASKVLGQMREGDPSSGGLSRRHILEAVEDSLRRLRTDWLDLYMPHHVDPAVPSAESIEAFQSLLKAGKVRAVGVSNFDGARLDEWAPLRPRFNQVQYSAAARRAERDLREGVPLLAWSPLGGGLLTGKYRGGARPAGRRAGPGAFPPLPETRLEPLVELIARVAELEGLTPAQTALGWVLSKPFVAAAIVGARTTAQLEETLSARPLSASGLAAVDRGSRVIEQG